MVSLICDSGEGTEISVQVAPGDISLLTPYLILLRDSQTHPLHTEPPVVPVNRDAAGGWNFCRTNAVHDQEPIPPEPGSSPSLSEIG